jgi:hypothetical protein
VPPAVQAGGGSVVTVVLLVVLVLVVVVLTTVVGGPLVVGTTPPRSTCTDASVSLIESSVIRVPVPASSIDTPGARLEEAAAERCGRALPGAVDLLLIDPPAAFEVRPVPLSTHGVRP